MGILGNTSCAFALAAHESGLEKVQVPQLEVPSLGAIKIRSAPKTLMLDLIEQTPQDVTAVLGKYGIGEIQWVTTPQAITLKTLQQLQTILIGTIPTPHNCQSFVLETISDELKELTIKSSGGAEETHGHSTQTPRTYYRPYSPGVLLFNPPGQRLLQ